ncbi:MAG: HaeIII family restriction endonuclease [Cyanobacteriota/Melainabacteria group bacterium]
MTAKASKHGKAFEYALLSELEIEIKGNAKFSIEKNTQYDNALASFESIDSREAEAYRAAARAGVLMLLRREPLILNPATDRSVLNICIQSDQEGGRGDVRDIVLKRSAENWEIGISAKKDHKALKSSRLSSDIDFGTKWLEHPCSKKYKDEVNQIFDSLSSKTGVTTWNDLGDYKLEVYEQILHSFKDELERIYREDKAAMPERLIRYLIGRFDFHKIMKIGLDTHLQSFNLNGDLGKKADKIKPRPSSNKLPLPKEIYKIQLKGNESRNTLILACDQGWLISFRIHNASTKIEKSLKFDINLEGQPYKLETQISPWG